MAPRVLTSQLKVYLLILVCNVGILWIFFHVKNCGVQCHGCRQIQDVDGKILIPLAKLRQLAESVPEAGVALKYVKQVEKALERAETGSPHTCTHEFEDPRKHYPTFESGLTYPDQCPDTDLASRVTLLHIISPNGVGDGIQNQFSKQFPDVRQIIRQR